MHRVVIVGGGFGGLNAALALRKAPVEVTVIDRRNFHLFQPLLYQVATGALSPGEIASPIRNILHAQKNTRVLLGEMWGLDANAREVILADGERVGYDSLIVAAGTVDFYFGHDDWKKNAPGLKSIEDATEIRKRILFAFEAAERETDVPTRRAWLTFVLVGGGPTGVELSGALAEIANDTLRHDFRSIDPRDAAIILVEGKGRILETFPEDLSKAAETVLQRKGVKTVASGQVTQITDDGVTVKFKDREEKIAAKTVLWAAGVRASGLGKIVADQTGAQVAKNGSVVVEPDCSIKGYPEIFIVGDLASFTHQGGKPLPGVAQVAIQQGTYAAKTIVKRLKNEPVKPFHYWDKGNLAVIGRLAAVAQIGRFDFHGALAWFIWLFVHILYLVGFENRMVVLMEWAFNYFTHNRSARLITGPTPGLPAPSAEPEPVTYASH
jgi:NADH dehydrogenase